MLITTMFSFSLPTTFSIGSGQHRFEQIDPNNPDEFCNKCHGTGDIIQEELMSSGNGVFTGIRIHSTLTCVSCHRITGGFGEGMPGEKTAHAAIIPTCEECHGINAIMDYNAYSELVLPQEAHKDLSGGSDLACLGCHTGVSIRGAITYSYAEKGDHELKGLIIG